MAGQTDITDDHYACFLSVLRVFAIFFETNRLFDHADREYLLEMTMQMFRFPPCVRAMNDLIRQRMLLVEDRSVLASCILGYYQKHHESGNTFEAQFPQMIFGLFYDQMSEKKLQDPQSPKRFSSAFSTANLTCAVSRKKLGNPVAILVNHNQMALLDSPVSKLYMGGYLRGTSPPSQMPVEKGNIILRLATFSGGRFDRLTFYKSDVPLERLPSASRVPKRQRDITYLIGEKQEVFAIHAPKDIPTVLPPALTRDETGKVCVFLETSKALPPTKYLPSWQV